MELPNIKIGNGLIEDALLASVEVVQELNQHWWCTVVCRQSEDKPPPVETYLGQTVEVRATDYNGVEHLLFSGFVLDVELLQEVWGSYTARLKAVSATYKLDLATRKEYYAAQTLQQVAQKAAGTSGLTASVGVPAMKALNYVQYGETDFSFLNRIVDDYGCWMRPSAEGLEVFNAFQAGGKVEWRAVDGLLGFKVKSRLAPASFGGSHYDHHTMASNTFEQVRKAPQFFGSAAEAVNAVQAQSSGVLPAGFEPQRARAMTLADYDLMLQGEAERSLGSAVVGVGESRSQTLVAGDAVEVVGALDAAGTYGLVRVVHTWAAAGYRNRFVCTPWMGYRNPRPPAQRDWQGVVPARVVAHDDPKKMGRLQVQFFWQAEGATHWARTVAPHAGPGRGFMFMPEVGDEVAVLFEDGDPERPIVLGAVWNGVQQAPRHGFFGAEEDIPDNNVKRMVTKSGNRFQMVDTPGKETVLFATPNHTNITLTEKHDATGRTLVTVHSDGDIVLHAPEGRVHVKAKYFSREVGVAGAEPATGATGTAPSADANVEKASWLGGFGGGLADSTYRPLLHMFGHPVEVLGGLGHAAAHPIDTAKAAGHAISSTAKDLMKGDGRAAGMALGTAGMAFIPGAEEAEAAEDLSRASKLGEVAEETGEASKLAGTGDVGSLGGKLASGVDEDAYASRLAEAQEAYPNKAGTIENHHVAPKYLGGAADGTTVPLDGAYHQMITNEFRNGAPYGSGPVSPQQLLELQNSVYSKFPLPPGV